MKADEILRKHENANEMHFHEVDRKWIIEAMEEYAALRQPPVSGQSEQFIYPCYSPCQKKPKKKPSRSELFWERLNDYFDENPLVAFAFEVFLTGIVCFGFVNLLYLLFPCLF